MPVQLEIYEQVFSNPFKPSLNFLAKIVSLILLNSHFSLNYPKPYVPNMIEVEGGMHINSKRKLLPENIQQFLDNATMVPFIFQ